MRIDALTARRRRRARGPRGEDRPRGGLPPHARRDVGGAPARRAALPRGGRGAVAVRARRGRAGAAAELARRVGLDARRTRTSAATHTPELAELWDEMTEVRALVPGATMVTADAGLGGARGDPRPGDPRHLARRPRRHPRRRGRRRPRARRVHADLPRLPRARGDAARARGEGRRARRRGRGRGDPGRLVVDRPHHAAGREKLRAAGFAPPAPRAAGAADARAAAVERRSAARTAARPRRGSRTSSARPRAARSASARAAASRSSSSRRSSGVVAAAGVQACPKSCFRRARGEAGKCSCVTVRL